MSDWNTPRPVAQRVILRGDLELTAPARLGNGDRGELVDLPLLRDAVDGRPLLTGTSIAGALRAYLQARERGYGVTEQQGIRGAAALLLGGAKGDEDGEQSPLIVDDSLALATAPEIRDGVKIDPRQRVALDKGKYDAELLPAGTRFPLRFELLLPDGEQADLLCAALASALAGFEQGEIPIGARRTRGFGRCRVNGWRVATFDLRDPDGLLSWLRLTPESEADVLSAQTQPVARALVVTSPTIRDARRVFQVEATFTLESPILIRSEEPLGRPDGSTYDEQPDFVQLRNARGQPIIPGTSLAGVLRTRAMRIAAALGVSNAPGLIDSLFGVDMHADLDGRPSASRMIVEEAIIEPARTVVQHRVAIDRFTGGAFETALFAEAPEVGGGVELTYSVRNPEPREIGLALLLLKDLWTADLPIGGSASIGRGRLAGVTARLTYASGTGDEPHRWELVDAGGGAVTCSGRPQSELEAFVAALAGEVGHGA